jgi:serine protease AprX
VLDESGNGRTSTVMAGMEWAVEQGAQVINVSLGGPPYPSDGTDAFSLLCNAAVDEGVVVCVAAGNLGPGGHTIGSPAAATSVLTVGASEMASGSHAEDIAPFSSRGPTGDGRVKPDVVFPGVGIVAPRSAGTALGKPLDDRYTAVSGTSQATPMAAGTAALLLEANPRLGPADVKARMVRGARRLRDEEPTAQGAGRGDSYNTFVAAEGDPLDPSEAPEDPTPPGVTPPATPRPAPTTPPPRQGEPGSRSGCLPGMAGLLLG